MSSRKEWELLDACKLGSLEKIRSLIDSKQVDLRRVIDTSLYNRTPLHYACV